jgi:hypothetical protein
MMIDLGPDEDTARKSAAVLGQSLPEIDRGTVVV